MITFVTIKKHLFQVFGVAVILSLLFSFTTPPVSADTPPQAAEKTVEVNPPGPAAPAFTPYSIGTPYGERTPLRVDVFAAAACGQYTSNAKLDFVLKRPDGRVLEWTRYFPIGVGEYVIFNIMPGSNVDLTFSAGDFNTSRSVFVGDVPVSVNMELSCETKKSSWWW